MLNRHTSREPQILINELSNDCESVSAKDSKSAALNISSLSSEENSISSMEEANNDSVKNNVDEAELFKTCELKKVAPNHNRLHYDFPES